CRPVVEIRNFCGEAVGYVKRMTPAGAPPIWKNFATTTANPGDAFAKLARFFPNALADFIGAIYADKFSLFPISDAVREPAMDPLSSRNCPGVAAVIVRLDTQKDIHPNDSRPAQRLFPLRNAQRFFPIGWPSEREFIFARRPQLSARVERVPRSTNANRIYFLRIDWGPILQPAPGLLFQ